MRSASRWLPLALCAGLSLFVQTAQATLFSATLPASRSAQVGELASFFATVINASTTTAQDCRVELVTPLAATFSYQRTDPASNVPIGAANTPADIAANATQSYVLSLTANAAIAPIDVVFSFVCANDGPAASFTGLNTLAYSASSQPTPDVIALALTTTGDGIGVLPPGPNLGFFAVASVNVGSSATLDVSARASGASASTLLVCETDPTSGACFANPGTTVTTTIAANATPTFAVFMGATTTVAFDPAVNRIFLEFKQGGALRGATSVAFASATALDVFSSNVSPDTLQTKCINCHVIGGVSDNTPLVFTRASEADNLAINLDVFQSYLDTTPNAVDRILDKVQGVSHGGGVQVVSGTTEFSNLVAFLDLLSGSSSSSNDPARLFDDVTMASAGATLKRAAILFAGRKPTAAEFTQANTGQTGLRDAIRGLMSGENFRRFLREGSNDRLLTDRQFMDGETIDPLQVFFVDYANENHDRAVDALNSGNYDSITRWYTQAQFGFARAPLELIVRIAENDLSYTEIMTADYIMANPIAAKAYGDTAAAFTDPNDLHEFLPVTIQRYFRNDFSKITEFELVTGSVVLDPGNLITDYPHAGILNTMAFLTRYPSTATNRNRARARWTYYHFLGVDIEKSAPRTTDPDALADTNNPTMNNAACTVCHLIMDPVAGAFQNYGDDGNYRDQFFGLDSLDQLYKEAPATPYISGDAWYRDMREPGLGTVLAPQSSDSVRWLAQQIAQDDRFSEAAIKFWWPSVMGELLTEAPAESTDANFEGKLLAANAQRLELDRLALGFRDGFASGSAYNLKDLLVELALSPWFRAASLNNSDPVLEVALADAGVEKLLTPEQLARKTLALTNFQWGRFYTPELQLDVDFLSGFYRLLYGGIDSGGVTVRATEVTTTMAAVAQTHAIESGCPIVLRDLFVLPEAQRTILKEIDRQSSPDTAAGRTQIRTRLVALFDRLLDTTLTINHPEIDAAYQLYVDIWNLKKAADPSATNRWFPGDNLQCAFWQDNRFFEGIDDNVLVEDPQTGALVFDIDYAVSLITALDLSDPNYAAQTWAAVISTLLLDYRYLYE